MRELVRWRAGLRSVCFSIDFFFFFSKHTQLHPMLELEKTFFNMHAKNTCLRLKRNPKVVMISLCSVLHHSGGRRHCAIR